MAARAARGQGPGAWILRAPPGSLVTLGPSCALSGLLSHHHERNQLAVSHPAWGSQPERNCQGQIDRGVRNHVDGGQVLPFIQFLVCSRHRVFPPMTGRQVL